MQIQIMLAEIVAFFFFSVVLVLNGKILIFAYLFTQRTLFAVLTKKHVVPSPSI